MYTYRMVRVPYGTHVRSSKRTRFAILEYRYTPYTVYSYTRVPQRGHSFWFSSIARTPIGAWSAATLARSDKCAVHGHVIFQLHAAHPAWRAMLMRRPVWVPLHYFGTVHVHRFRHAYLHHRLGRAALHHRLGRAALHRVQRLGSARRCQYARQCSDPWTVGSG